MAMKSPHFKIGAVSGLGQQPMGRGTTPLASTSEVKTAGPFSQGHMRQYGQPKVAAQQYGSGAGSRSQGAFAQASAQQAGNQYRSGMEQANMASQQNLEKVRSADIYGQRADQTRRFGLEEGYKADKRGIEISEREDGRNLRNRLEENRKNTALDFNHNMLNLLVGGGMMSSLGNAQIASRGGQPFFGNNLMGSAMGMGMGGGFSNLGGRSR